MVSFLTGGLVAETDFNDWLAAFLRTSPAPEAAEADNASASGVLRSASFADIVQALEQAGPGCDASMAIRLYSEWIGHQPPHTPQLFAAWFNLAVAYSQAGDQGRAVVAYRNALALRPDFHSASVNLGTALETLGLPEEALQTWSGALQSDDMRTMLLNNRGRLLEQMGRLKEAEVELHRSLLTNPRQPDVVQHWIHLRQKMCRWPALTELPGLPRNELLHQAGPLSVLALTDDIGVQSEAAKQWLDRKTYQVAGPLCPSSGYKHEKIRLGYMSSDFCRHAMSYLIAEVFESHDRNSFELFAYCNSQDDGSEIRARIIRGFDHFRVIRGISDESAAQQIRADEIDILIDLNGLTSGARPQVLRWKPAPVQATYLGFIGPVPIPELDYLFCDDIVIPPEMAGAYQPAPLAIGENYQANDTRRGIGRTIQRSEAGLPDDRFVFCCFSNHYKTTEDVFAAWMAILRRVDRGVLWLVGDNEWARSNMTRFAAEHGIDPDRMIFAPRVGPDDYMARLRCADLFLDTFPYNAGTIASDAIRMGLPLVTIGGQSFASRMASRLLAALGAQRGICKDIDSYIDTAVDLATDSQRHAAYKALFGRETWERSLGDTKRFTQSLEATLIRIARADLH